MHIYIYIYIYKYTAMVLDTMEGALQFGVQLAPTLIPLT